MAAKVLTCSAGVMALATPPAVTALEFFLDLSLDRGMGVRHRVLEERDMSASACACSDAGSV
jgi:hypothetical protein